MRDSPGYSRKLAGEKVQRGRPTTTAQQAANRRELREQGRGYQRRGLEERQRELRRLQAKLRRLQAAAEAAERRRQDREDRAREAIEAHHARELERTSRGAGVTASGYSRGREGPAQWGNRADLTKAVRNYGGLKPDPRHGIAAEDIPPAIRARAGHGVPPDEVAADLGFEDGEQLVRHYRRLTLEQQAARRRRAA